MMAEARTSPPLGVHHFVHHPLYLAKEIATIGGVMQFLPIWTGLLLIVQIACQIRRMSNEKTVLMDAFSEYSSDKLTTSRIIPGLY